MHWQITILTTDRGRDGGAQESGAGEDLDEGLHVESCHESGGEELL